MSIDPSTVEPGERILWSGRPNALRAMQAGSGLTTLIGFALLILFEYLAQAGHDGRFPPWVATIVLIAAIGLLLRPLSLAWRARRTDYVVTDRRALSVVRTRFPRTDAMQLSEIVSTELRPRAGGIDDVLMFVAGTAAATPRLVFRGITDASKVQALLRAQTPKR